MKILKITIVAGFLGLFSCADIAEKKKATCNPNVECCNGAGQCGGNNGTISNNTAGSNNGATNNTTTNTNNQTSAPNNGIVENVCGDGKISAPETCDGNCPTTCDDGNVCTRDSKSGSAANCDLLCNVSEITECIDGDGCCAPNCGAQDSDCQSCGNGIVDGNESCDRAIPRGQNGACQTNCDDADACTSDTLRGDAASCSAMCSNTRINACLNNDGCCPAGCGAGNDNDCQTLYGSACTSDNQCGSDGICTDYPGGFCTKICQNNAECGANAFCAGGVCVPSCQSAADCRPGHACNNFYGISGTKTCSLSGAALRKPGTSCTRDGQCQSNFRSAVCIDEVAFPDIAGGVCTTSCQGTNDSCQKGASCSVDVNGGAICLKPCVNDSNCRQGFSCVDRGNGANVCFVSADGNGDVGDPCSGIHDCSGGSSGLCLKDLDGGYCTLRCTGNTQICGPDNCVGTQNGESYCLKSCATNFECRSGYTCQDTGTNFDSCLPPI